MCKRNDQCRLFCALWSWQSTCSSVQGLHPFVSVGTFNFGFVWAEALQAAVCWRFPPTHSSGSPEHSSADMAARPQSLCSAQSAQPWNWIQSCISTFIKINKLKRTPVTHDYKSTMTFLIKYKQLLWFSRIILSIKVVAKWKPPVQFSKKPLEGSS